MTGVNTSVERYNEEALYPQSIDSSSVESECKKRKICAIADELQQPFTVDSTSSLLSHDPNFRIDRESQTMDVDELTDFLLDLEQISISEKSSTLTSSTQIEEGNIYMKEIIQEFKRKSALSLLLLLLLFARRGQKGKGKRQRQKAKAKGKRQ